MSDGFFKNHYPSLLTKFSSFVTHHLKYPNFLIPTHLAHITQFLITQFFLHFVGPIPEHHVRHSCQPTHLTPFQHFIIVFSLQPPILSQNQRLQPSYSSHLIQYYLFLLSQKRKHYLFLIYFTPSFSLLFTVSLFTIAMPIFLCVSLHHITTTIAHHHYNHRKSHTYNHKIAYPYSY